MSKKSKKGKKGRQMVAVKETQVCVQGFEIDADLAGKLTDDAVFILGHVKRRGAATFQTDDGDEDAKTVEQLRKVAAEGYFAMFSERDDHVHAIIDDGMKFQVKMSH